MRFGERRSPSVTIVALYRDVVIGRAKRPILFRPFSRCTLDARLPRRRSIPLLLESKHIQRPLHRPRHDDDRECDHHHDHHDRHDLTPVRKVVAYGLLADSVRMLVGATSVVYLMSRGVSLAQIGTMKAMQAGIIMALDVPLGYLADRIGRRWIITLSVTCTAIWLGLTGWTPSIAMLFIAEAFNSFALAGLNGAFSATLLETYQKQTRQRDFENVLGVYGRAQFGLMACAAALGAVAGSHISPTVWWIAAALTLMLAVSTPWMLPRELANKQNKQALSWKTDANTIREVVLTGSGMAWLISSQVIFLLAYQIIIQFWQPLVDNLAVHRIEGWMFGATFVAILLAQSLASHHARTAQSLWPNLILCCVAAAAIGATYLMPRLLFA